MAKKVKKKFKEAPTVKISPRREYPVDVIGNQIFYRDMLVARLSDTAGPSVVRDFVDWIKEAK